MQSDWNVRMIGVLVTRNKEIEGRWESTARMNKCTRKTGDTQPDEWSWNEVIGKEGEDDSQMNISESKIG